MTNEQIIFNQSLKLMEDGIIGTTGRTFEFTDAAGNTITTPEPEPIHTYAAWRGLGYQVQKGQKAIASFMIWKHTGRKEETVTDGEGNEQSYIDRGHMFLKTAGFFKASQVKKIEA